VLAEDDGTPLQIVRIHHTIVLHDPFDDPPGLVVPELSPLPKPLPASDIRMEADEELDEHAGMTKEQILEEIEEEKGRARAEVLTFIGDLPHKDVAPEKNVLFVCKLNPITNSEDLEVPGEVTMRKAWVYFSVCGCVVNNLHSVAFCGIGTVRSLW
tara:strand:+ start:761 stop:1228 length:468 start_codon:yes stop_codon:yes gene_type:complete